MPTSVTHLVSRMTLEEKVAQLTSLDIMKMAMAVRGVDPADRGAALAARLPEIAPHGVGHFPTMLGMLAPGIDEAAGFYRQVQDGATAASRFAIPALIQVEALNGAVMPGAPTYPTGIAQAATWRPELVQRMADLTRQRLLGYGIRHALSSVLDLARDPRWGRVHETYGEDPDLIAALGVAFVRGMQSGDLRDGVAACAKHFIAYSASQGGLNQGGVAVGPRSLREQWARPFEAVIREADVATAMNSYSEIDGAPVAADPAMLTGLLRDELGFDGFVVSDYDSVGHLFSRQFVAEDAPAAAILALKAGLDTEFLNPVCFQHLPQLVRQGRLDEALIDRATRLGTPSAPPVLVHGDLHVRHVLSVGGVATGVIDWGDTALADPAVDLMIGYAAFTGDVRSAFLSAYGPVDHERETRARMLALHVSAVLAEYALAEGLDDLAREALAAMGRSVR